MHCENLSALRGFEYTFVMAVNYLLGVTHATVAKIVMVFRLKICVTSVSATVFAEGGAYTR